MATFKIIGKEIEYGGKKFNAYKTKMNGSWIDVKFTRECENAPKTAGKFEITANETDMNISVKGFYKELWVKKCVSSTEIKPKQEFNFDDDLPF